MEYMSADDRDQPHPQEASAEAATAAVIDTARDPRISRVIDVLRAGSATRKTFLIDDEENIEQAINNGVLLDTLYCTDGTELSAALSATVRERQLPVHTITASVAKEIFGGAKRSRLFALARQPKAARLSDLTDRPGDIVVLDGVRIAGNIGAITRTACGLHAAGVILIDSGLTTTADRRIVRASRGTVFALPVVLADRADILAYLDEQPVTVVSLAADAAEPLHTISELGGRLAIVLGSERTGASQDLESRADKRFSIAMNPSVESLNVSVVTGIALYSHAVK